MCAQYLENPTVRVPDCPCRQWVHDSIYTSICHSFHMLAWIRIYASTLYDILSSDACCRVAVQLSVGLEVGQLVSVKREIMD